MDNTMNVAIILVNYNGLSDTIECLKSLENQTYKNINIVIIDNASINQEYYKLVEYIKQFKMRITVLKSDQNVGFAGANNIGIKYAKNKFNSDFFLLLNNDTLVKPDFLKQLMLIANKDKNIGLVGAKIYYYPDKNKIWYAGGKINWFKYTTVHLGDTEIDVGKYNEEVEVDFITGCVMLIKSNVIQEVGYLPEEYFMYYEDFDYCVQVKDAGFKLYYAPKSIVYHKISASTGGEQSPFSIEYGTKNRRLIMRKYKNKISLPLYFLSKLYFYISRLVRITQYLLQGNTGRAKAVVRGIFINYED